MSIVKQGFCDGRAFKKRHNQLVKSYMSAKQRATNGLKLLLNNTEPFSQVQASWRFLNNDKVSTDALFELGKSHEK